jgi:Zn ribbon nucleic-acid-binding protein
LLCPKISHMDTACKHPKVRVVAREEDVEYVECLDCGQVFDSQEYRDMEIEEVLGEAEEDR